MMSTLIRAEQLTRYYGKHCAVNNVSFNLAKGQILGFLGENGAGKTTTLQMLCGNLAPSSGEVFINDVDMLKQPRLAKRSLGYVPDTPPLYKELSVQEFLVYCAQLHGVPKADINAAVDLAKSRCGLSEVADRLIGVLSKGFQQRLGIAQAIVHNPDVIVLDEPTVGLDPVQIREIRSLIRELGENRGIIFSTHILSEVQETCTDVMIIHQGQMVLNSSIHELNQRMNTGILLVTTKKAMDVSCLSGIAGINSIEMLSDQQIKIHHSLDNNPGQQIMATILAQGWELQELTPVKQSLEDIFINLTQQPPGRGNDVASPTIGDL